MPATTSDPSKPLWSLPIRDRPPHGSLLRGLIWASLFNLGILLTHVLQLLLSPLLWHPRTRSTFHRWTKAPFGRLCVWINQAFAPTSFVISRGADEVGGDGVEDIEQWITRDSRGRVTKLDLPKRAVWISNHQTLCDWIFIWAFTYLSDHSNSVVITLKSSLRKIPIVGWACHFYSFIFLDRKWLTDQEPFKKQLKLTADDLKNGLGGDGEEKLALLIFPEGTLVTGNTRPISAKFAQKMQIQDLTHVLLPRSTGLFYALRELSPRIPDLHLVDLTIAYPGTHLPTPQGFSPTWPEDFYSLGIWFHGVPPPAIHLHIRVFEVSKIPLGAAGKVEEEEENRKRFDEWLRERWGEKDELMKKFVKEGSFTGTKEEEMGKRTKSVEWPVEVRYSFWEIPGAFSFGLPILALLVLTGLWKGWFSGGRHGELLDKVSRPCCAEAAKKALEAKKALSGEL
ncbi:hypothetical protein MVLG_06450 [Microbotryum lychnidis-dioicae p1A1 Lamole]|uniref:Phospholipid/glycerol acyltransferase domain-containing protein n=2 Tax=Microbotryum TaxID=34416 RepID=U5HHB5_USTV1|nr:hypothetical protein MVLG_06450 [Microbotryum lychnidis-dioicae p1A1 Lamole]|eukprot:KDE03018.1 hypothetical protein MVLG_06450 [Microbotryum lychnidis-dioicae p1A1 Lamole]